jgi:hypothetical protein
MAVSFNTASGVRGVMDRVTTPDFDAAARFVAGNARVLDRRRFERLFLSGGAEPIRDAVAAYRNADGGFGHGLEPDCRAPDSQPAAVEMALRVMNECDSWDLSLVSGACDWLSSVAPREGGAAFVEPTVSRGPHAPWWVPEDGHPASLIATGMIAGTLHARGFSHPWLDRASDVMWARLGSAGELGSAEELGSAGEPGAYEMFGVLAFLQHVPDRDRAREAFGRVGPLLLESKLVELDPDAPGEVHGPLDFAPEPSSMARDLFDDEVIDRHIAHLAARQGDDGGWTFNWQAWSAAAERDWRGAITVDALRTLRANGR